MTIDEWKAMHATKRAEGRPLWVTAHGRPGRVLRVTHSGVVVKFDGDPVALTLHPDDVAR